MMYMLDTNICIYLLNSRSASLLETVKSKSKLCMSAVSYAELCFGIENGAAESAKASWSQLGLFVRLVEVLPFSDSAGKNYGKIRAYLKKKGMIIGNNDMFIAAHAMSENAVLVSNNMREFQRIPDLKLENWI